MSTTRKQELRGNPQWSTHTAHFKAIWSFQTAGLAPIIKAQLTLQQWNKQRLSAQGEIRELSKQSYYHLTPIPLATNCNETPNMSTQDKRPAIALVPIYSHSAIQSHKLLAFLNQADYVNETETKTKRSRFSVTVPLIHHMNQALKLHLSHYRTYASKRGRVVGEAISPDSQSIFLLCEEVARESLRPHAAGPSCARMKDDQTAPFPPPKQKKSPTLRQKPKAKVKMREEGGCSKKLSRFHCQYCEVQKEAQSSVAATSPPLPT